MSEHTKDIFFRADELTSSQLTLRWTWSSLRLVGSTTEAGNWFFPTGPVWFDRLDALTCSLWARWSLGNPDLAVGIVRNADSVLTGSAPENPTEAETEHGTHWLRPNHRSHTEIRSTAEPPPTYFNKQRRWQDFFRGSRDFSADFSSFSAHQIQNRR